MSHFLRDDLKNLAPYVPGEQPGGRKFIKLNTNESPFPPSEKAVKMAYEAAKELQLYPALDGGKLRPQLAEKFGLSPREIVVTNGSDEVLNFCFRAFCGPNSPAAFADITYGFYSVFAELNGVPYSVIPLKEDFSLDPEDYVGLGKNVFIANPNAPTGLAISLDEIEKIADSNPDNIVLIDEAYVDFGGQSAIPLIRKHQNLIVTQTFSKSRSLAGARVGFTAACPEIIDDLYRVIYSTNPYNLSRTNLAAAIGALSDEEYTIANCQKIISVRSKTARELRKLGFTLTDSLANFIFAKSDRIGGKELYELLKAEGILIRHFNKPRISDYVRITIGSAEDMEVLTKTIAKILERR